MDWELAEYLAGISGIAYEHDPEAALRAASINADVFETANFSGFVASAGDVVMVVFRGTQRPIEWLVNIDYAQVPWCGGMVHEGFLSELFAVWPTLHALLLRHGAPTRQCLVTGHSAGGGMATLAAQYLKQEGFPISAAYVYCSPRVGDPGFGAQYSLPLFRFEYQDDVVPHVPFSPATRTIAQVGLRSVIEILMRVHPGFMRLQPGAWTYVHAGTVYYFDEDGNVQYNADAGSVVGGLLGELFGGKKTGPRLMAVPATVLEYERIGILAKNLATHPGEELRARLAHHHGIQTIRQAIAEFRRNI